MNYKQLIIREGRRRHLSPRTIHTYCFCVDKFMRWIQKDPKTVTKQDILVFLDILVEKNVSGSTLNVYHMAIRFFYTGILQKRVTWNIKYAKTPKRLPVFLTKEEVHRLLEAINNDTHQLMIALLYGSGLRVSELTHLTKENLDLENKTGWVRHGKGDKDRVFIIPESLIDRLNVVLENKNTRDYLFRGRHGPLHVRSIQEILKNARRKAKIEKCVHPHTLRHSFATHLVENGTDICSIQSLLGHNSTETTMIYIHMAKPKLVNVKSPLENIHKAAHIFSSSSREEEV